VTLIEIETSIWFYYTADWHECADWLPSPVPAWEYGLPGGDPMDIVATTGMLSFALDNSAANAAGLPGFYSPGHANCPAWFTDGLPVKVVVERMDTHVSATKFTGVVTAIRPTSGVYEAATTEVECRDWMDYAHVKKIGELFIEANKRADQALTSALAEFPLQPTGTNFEAGIETFLSIFNTDDSLRMTMASLFQKLARNECMGQIFLDGDGTLRFHNRNHRLVTAPLFTLDATADSPMDALTVAWRRQAIKNRVECKIWPSVIDAASTTVLWKLQLSAPSLSPAGNMPLAAGETATLTCPYRDPVTGTRISAIDVVDPLVSGTHIKLGSIDDGATNDLAEAYCTGGTVTQVGGQRIHTFTGDDTLVVVRGGAVKSLIVAGGGGGGGTAAGNAAGGGGGGTIYNAADVVTAGNKAVVVGAGGAYAAGVQGGVGGASSFNGVSATGGGGGGIWADGADGGNGGSGGGVGQAFGGSQVAGTGIAGQGFAGGAFIAAQFAGSGGGGAGALGGQTSGANSKEGGVGGAGISSSISGAALWYGGGGGGSTHSTGSGVAPGGSGVGGAGHFGATAGTAGMTNRGGGGGGGGETVAGGVGGSGIVIVSYPYPGFSNSMVVGGNTAKITLTNNLGVTGYVNLLELWGKGIYTYEPMVLSDEDAASIALRGERPLEIRLEQISNPVTAQGLATYTLGLTLEPRGNIDSVRFLANFSDDFATAAIDVEPNAPFLVVEEQSGTQQGVIAARLKYRQEGPKLWVEIVPAPIREVNYFTWDLAGHGWDEGVWTF